MALFHIHIFDEMTLIAVEHALGMNLVAFSTRQLYEMGLMWIGDDWDAAIEGILLCGAEIFAVGIGSGMARQTTGCRCSCLRVRRLMAVRTSYVVLLMELTERAERYGRIGGATARNYADHCYTESNSCEDRRTCFHRLLRHLAIHQIGQRPSSLIYVKMGIYVGRSNGIPDQACVALAFGGAVIPKEAAD